MFCYQCEETLKNTACVNSGICGKPEDVAGLQDLLLYNLRGISFWVSENKENAITIKDATEADHFVMNGLFTTVTNVNFDIERMKDLIETSLEIRNKYKRIYLNNRNALLNKDLTGLFPDSAVYELNEKSMGEYHKKSLSVSLPAAGDIHGEDILSLRELLMYGLKGAAAYAHHAYILNYEDRAIYDFFHKGLNALNKTGISQDELIELILECGEIGIKVMELLDRANTAHYGIPTPTSVNTGTKKGKAILISGHDLYYLEELLKQTENTGISVYTHGEMLPAHAYPMFKKYKHLAGNYGGAWWKQQDEFDRFNGSIVMTTNCIQKPKESYKNRLFTIGLVAMPEVKHINGTDFTEAIKKASELEGLQDKEGKKLTIGFAHDALLNSAEKILDLIKRQKINRFVVMAGCDGREPKREYYTKIAKKLPKDSVILTAGCAKFRYNDLELGEIEGIPRVIDAGQCNDSYSLALTAIKLKEALNLKDINDLPIYYDIAWYEQKAVLVLLSLLKLGVKNIKLGPNLPAFLSENVKNILIDQFNIMPISKCEDDLRFICGEKMNA